MNVELKQAWVDIRKSPYQSQQNKHEWKKKPVALNTSQYEHNSMDRDSERGKGKKRKHEVEYPYNNF